MSEQLTIQDHYSHTLLNILLPEGGYVNIFQAYADASGIDGPVLTVANFLFDKEKSEKLNEEWSKILYPILKNEPPNKQYFHMYDFNLRKGPYAYLNSGEKDYLQRCLIDSAHSAMEYGVVGSVLRGEYDNAVSKSEREFMGGPFTMCNIWCMEELCGYLKRNNKEGDIAYFFEDGDNDKGELELRLARINASQFLRKKYRYAGRTFLSKHQHHALGAADMLAWEYRNAIREHFMEPEKPHGAFLYVLFEQPTMGALHFSKKNLFVRSMSQAIEQANQWAEERREQEQEQQERNVPKWNQ